MPSRADTILAHLRTVEGLRRSQAGEPAVAARVAAVKQYQGRRFEKTYGDWIANPGAERACRFFLDQLYGAEDFSRRDTEFARVVPTMTRLFPDELSATIESLSALHALSETLDSAMAKHLTSPDIAATNYASAWQATAQPRQRARQIDLMLAVGRALVTHTRKPMLKRMLKMMRSPAAAAGLGTLQQFLEEGFESFASLPDADAFLHSVHERETLLCVRLFEVDPAQLENRPSQPPVHNGKPDPLGQLP